ncbi:hypothetical protein J5N97_002531 [Dioscorea zingiberensis]|uniref:DNA ligase n=1 Tax=Dioscorea zingiberensis TaxID=325984 RepID=A0A9D5D4Z0_9LILI|nr:hypothetical protein J5N97_002531 [Dioscorea zingiberensis]
MTEETVRFGLLCSMFQAMLRDRTAGKKRKRLRTFLDRVYTGREYFSAVRLILPGLDRERGTYGLKESALANALVDALGISKDSDDARRLINWRKGGARSGANAGNFALVAAEVLQRRQGLASGGMTIKELNDALDRLASSENRGDKAAILSDLIKKTNALEMKWILMIILKDLKLGISEKSIFHEFHPDAEDLFNVTCDLKLVCDKLKDPTQRHKRQDIDVGKAVRPQLAMRVSNASTAWKKLQGKNVVVECKFDGDRIQIHKNGGEIHFYSRNFLDHTEYSHGMSGVILKNILVERCILDGEMLVWDTSAQRFAEFGSNQEIAKAAREGLESDRQLCYVAFDILYAGDTSVIHQSLTERQSLLQRVVKPLKGHLEILVPNGGINDVCAPGEPCWSIIAHSVDDVEKFFKETVERRDEGVVLKDLGSKWEPGDRSGKWLKLKPDYIHAGADLDALIIGGYFGSGRHGGEVAQFLLGLAERSDSGYPKRFVSFCRVGTGLSDEELDALISKLKPYFRKNEHPKKVPRFYEVTNNSKERPDVWIDSPDKSVILSITSDIRTIKSEVFAAPYSLRFPRIQRVRYDKPWHECLDVQSFVDLVHASNGNTQRRIDDGGLQTNNSMRTKTTKKKDKGSVSVVPAHFVQTDISSVKEETFIFANMMFYFINTPPLHSVEYFHKLVAENGGTFSMNLNDSVTHCIAAERKGIKYQAAMRHGDIIHYSWILDCCAQKRLLHLQPKYFLFLTESSKSKFQEEIDPSSDYYYLDLDIMDIKQIFNNMTGAENVQITEYYKKYCPWDTMRLFHGCCIYFCETANNRNVDSKVISELSVRRMRLEASMHGGEVCGSLSHATHLVAYSTSESYNFDEIYQSFPPAQRRFLHGKKLHIITHLWLEDSIQKGKRLPEDEYNLKPDTLEAINTDSEEGKQDHETHVTTSETEKQKFAEAVDISGKRKRGRPLGSINRKGRPGLKPVQRTRTRTGNRAVKLNQDEPVGDSSDEHGRGASESSEPSCQEVNEDKNDKDQGTHRAGPSEACGHLTEVNEEQDLRRDKVDEEPLDVHAIKDMKEGTSEKLEQMVDPLQAMLLDMIPTLSQKKVETSTSVPECEKPQPDPGATQVKKKVSYKDVAGELLKDW